MGQQREMPTKNEIFDYWKPEVPDIESKICWGCGFKRRLFRCHIKARVKYKPPNRGRHGSDHPSNIVLLCESCHRRQEIQCKTDRGRELFKRHLINGALYMTTEVNAYIYQYIGVIRYMLDSGMIKRGNDVSEDDINFMLENWMEYKSYNNNYQNEHIY